MNIDLPKYNVKDIDLPKDIVKYIDLPKDIVKYILLFDKRFTLIKGKVRMINRLQREDKRYEILNSIPPKCFSYDLIGRISFVYLPINENSEFHLLCRENKIILEKIMYSSHTSNCCCGKITNYNVVYTN